MILIIIRECGCGVGDSGCAECGCCRICARESCDNGGDMAVFGPSGGGDLGMMRLHMLFEGSLNLPATQCWLVTGHSSSKILFFYFIFLINKPIRFYIFFIFFSAYKIKKKTLTNSLLGSGR